MIAEVWRALENYAASCLEEGRGLQVPNFGQLGWHPVTCRPHFVMADSFIRTYGVVAAKSNTSTQNLGHPVEAFDFSKAAIRYSRKLTKDQVSSGLRVIIQQLGEVVSRGRMVDIQLSFGKIVAREREVHVSFDPSFFAACDRAVPVGNAETVGAVDSDTCANGAVVHQGGWTYEPRGGADVLVPSCQGTCTSFATEEPQNDPTTFRAEISRTQPTAAPRLQASVQSYVLDEATHRHVTELEIRASEALRDRAEIDWKHQKALDETKQANEKRQAQILAHRAQLQRQIKEREERLRQGTAVEQQNEGFAGASGFSQGNVLPTPVVPRLHITAANAKRQRPDALTSHERERMASETSTPAVLAIVSSSARSVAQSKFRQALDEQVQSKQAHKAALRKFELNVDARMAQAVSHEIAAQRDCEKAARKQEREELDAAWREHRKMKDIQKTIESIEHGQVASSAGPQQGTSRQCTPRCMKPSSAASISKSTCPPASAAAATNQRSIASAASALTAAASSQYGPLSARCLSRGGAPPNSLGAAAALALH
jgi:hypothetical protein